MKVLWIILAYVAGTAMSTAFIWMAVDWIFGVQKWMEDNQDGFGDAYVTAVVLLCMLMTLPCVVAGGVIAWLLLT